MKNLIKKQAQRKGPLRNVGNYREMRAHDRIVHPQHRGHEVAIQIFFKATGIVDTNNIVVMMVNKGNTDISGKNDIHGDTVIRASAKQVINDVIFLYHT